MLDAQISTWPQAQAAIERGRLAVLPFGAHEQHGPHLPLSTDTLIAAGLAARLARPWMPSCFPPSRMVKPGRPPVIPARYRSAQVRCNRSWLISGAVSSARGFPVDCGQRPFWQPSPMRAGLPRPHEIPRFPVLLVDFPGLDQLAASVCQSKPAAPGFYHADEVETSLMLAIQPDTVQMALAAPEYPVFPPTFGAEPWPLDAFCSSGVFGDPTSSSKGKGEILLDGLLQNSLELVYAFLKSHRISLPKS